MESLFKEIVSHIALGIEGVAALVIMYGAIEAVCRLIHSTIIKHIGFGERKDTWRRFAVWLLIGLEFTLAADILRTAFAPTWTDIGQLASIAVIRTFLNYFLEKDIENVAERKESQRGEISREIMQ